MTRKTFLQLLVLLLSGANMQLFANEKQIEKAPAFFVGHGSPMNAIADNAFTKSLKNLGKRLDKPKAILMISAHWTPPYTGVTVHENSDLMYDFFGFPDELEEVRYKAPNGKELTSSLEALLGDVKVKNRALDHGAWSVLVHLFPDADIPVMQFGINKNLSLREHFKMAERIAVLREMGVMIIGSGNVTELSHLISDKNKAVHPYL